MTLPGYCSLQNAANHEFRCDRAKHLEKPYRSPECLMKLVYYEDDVFENEHNVYAIQSSNSKFFRSNIGGMDDAVTSNEQKWSIAEAGNGRYTIRNVANGKYMTSSASKLSRSVDGNDEYWVIESRASDVAGLAPDYGQSYYGTLQNMGNAEYRNDHATQMTKDVTIPANLFKMVRLADGHYGIQNQDNYEYLQSSISRMTGSIDGPGQEWTLVEYDRKTAQFKIRNLENGKYMTQAASHLSSDDQWPKQVWTIETFDCADTAGWMGANWDVLAHKPLPKLCFPGSHDSGTFMATHSTQYGGPRVTRTQIFDIQMQLMQGVRFLDMRPVLYKSDFYTAHYTQLGFLDLGYQGAIGVELKAALDQVKAFVTMHERELVILDFSHFMSWDRRDGDNRLTRAEQQALFNVVRTALKDVMIRGEGGDSGGRLLTQPLGELIDMGNVIVLADTPDGQPADGLWPKWSCEGGYSNTNVLADMISSQKKKLEATKRGNGSFMFELCWQLTLQGAQNGPTGSGSILSLAAEANRALYPHIQSWLSGDQPVINQQIYPNVINTDACEESVTRAVALSMLINGRLDMA